MDSSWERRTSPSPSVPSRPLAPEALRAALDSLDRAFAPPLDRFRSALGGVRDETTRTLAYLCDDLRGLTGRFREYLGSICERRAPRPAPMRLSTLLEEVDRLAAPEALSRGQDWLCTLQGEDVEVCADLALCAEILARLASNAIGYAPPGSRIRASAEAGPGTWSMAVRDNGPGIPADRLERLFEPFERLARDVEAEIPGAGLGLAICRALTARMGGTITLESPGEGGLCATVVLPRTPSVETA